MSGGAFWTVVGLLIFAFWWGQAWGQRRARAKWFIREVQERNRRATFGDPRDHIN